MPARPVIAPKDALVTGYDFLIDEATSISNTLRAQGITTLTTLINNTWTASVFSSTFFSRADGLQHLVAQLAFRALPSLPERSE